MSIDLVSVLLGAGVEVIGEVGDEVRGRCPRHRERTGKEDVHPSWSINSTKFKHFCFSCGYAGTLTSLLRDLTGSVPGDLELELQTSGLLRTFEDYRKSDERKAVAERILSDWDLRNKLIDVPEKLLARRFLRREAIDTYEVRFDTEVKSWVLPLRDAKGELVGAQYRGAGMAITKPAGLLKSELLFGFHPARVYEHVVLVESPLDAVRLFGLGIPAVASLGAFVSEYQCKLLARNFSRVYLALDNDEAGWTGIDHSYRMIERLGSAALLWDYLDSDAKDVGDVEDDDELMQMWESTRRFGAVL